jgi:pyruvate dehydrogenase E1 component alpha subunit
LAKKYATEADLNAMDEKIKEIVEEAVNFAEQSEYPDASELFTDVYTQQDYPFITE